MNYIGASAAAIIKAISDKLLSRLNLRVGVSCVLPSSLLLLDVDLYLRNSAMALTLKLPKKWQNT